MEPSEGTGPLGAENLLGVPTLNDCCYEDDEEVRATLKPRFSPLPRRRSSVSDDDAEAEGPSTVARKVSFADAFGLDLVSVKEFDMWDLPATAQSDTFEGEVAPVEEFSLSPLFELASGEEARRNLRAQKVLLDSVELLPGCASMKGVIRVLNVCYEKSVYVRMSLDDWLSYYDILAEYVPDSCDGETDQFSFRMSMVPPYQKDGARVEFCIRYQTSAGTFWANNGGRNYALLCRKMGGLQEAEKQLEDAAENLKKSCLKMSQSKEDNPLEINESDTWTHSNPPDTAIPEIVYPPEDNDAEEIDETIDPKAMQLGRHNERELELLLSQQLIRIRDTPADQRSLNASGHSNFSRDEQRDEDELTLEETSTALHTLSSPLGTFSKDSSEQEGQLPVSDNQSLENFAIQPSKEEETTDPASDISPYLQHAVVSPGEDMHETDDIQTMYVTEDLTNLQGITMVDITKGGAECESRLVDIMTISEEPYGVRQEAISSGRGASEPITEGLDGNANPPLHLETENAVIKRDSLQGASLDRTDGESLEMGKALIAEIGLGAVVPQSMSSCSDSVETLEHEMAVKAGDVLGNDNIKWEQSVSDVPLICAIREEECTCQSDTYYLNVHSELQEQDEEERAHAQSFLINDQQDLSTVNTLLKTEESLMNTCGADETSANESYTSMPTALPEGYESGGDIPAGAQEITSSDTLSPWNGGQSELSDFWGEYNRMDPCPFSSTVTDHPLGYHDSVVTVSDAGSSISILQKAEDQAASGLETSGPIQCQNGASSENVHFDKEDDQESHKASTHTESTNETLVDNVSFTKPVSQWSIETSDSEHTESQNEGVAEMAAFFVQDEGQWTAEPKDRESHNVCVLTNIGFGKEDSQSAIEFSASKHNERRNEGVAENLSFVEEGIQNIATSAPEEVEGHYEGPKESVYFAEMYSQKAPETSVSEYLESQKDILAESPSFAKEEIQETFETLAPEYTEGQNECISEMIASGLEAIPWNIETSAPVHAEGQCDAIGENVSLAEEGHQTILDTTALEHLGSQDESMAENKTFTEEDSLKNTGTSAPEQIKGHNEGAKESVFFAEMYDQKASETSVSEYLESQKEILSENPSFVKEEIQETFETLAPEYTEGQNECMSEMIASGLEAIPWNIETLAPVHAEGQCDGMVENVPVAKEGNLTSLETTALEHLGSQDESMENKSFTEEDSRKNIGTSAPEHRESQHELEESILQSELSPFQFESEESHYVMWDESNSDLLEDPTAYTPEMQSTEREYDGNEMDTGTEDTESLGIWGENPSGLLVDPTEELLISQEIISSDGYILSDYSIEEEALLIGMPVEDILETPPVGESTIIFEDMNEEVKKEGTTEEVISSEDQEANIGRSLDTPNDKPSMSRGKDEDIQERIEASIEGALQRDSLSGGGVPQESIECNIRSIPPIQDSAWPVDTEQVMFQEELYIEESPGEPDMVGEHQTSEVNYSISIESDMKPPSYDFSTAFVGGSNPTGGDWEDHSSSLSASSTISDANTCVGSSYSLTALYEDRDTLSIIQPNDGFKEPDSYPPVYSSNDIEETGGDRYVQQPDTTVKTSQRPEVFISEATSERRKGVSERDKEMAPKTMFQLHRDEQQERHRDLHSDATSLPKGDESVAASESLILKRVSYKVFYFLVFVVFAVIIHQYDLTICFVLYFVSLYLLFWERGARKEPVKKE